MGGSQRDGGWEGGYGGLEGMREAWKGLVPGGTVPSGLGIKAMFKGF